MSTTMKAAVLGAAGLQFTDAPRPVPGADEVLVKVRAAGLNRADLGMLAGRMHGSSGGVGTPLGLEFAGEVVEVGRNVTRFKSGDAVMSAGKGGFAEYAVADAGRVMSLPSAGMAFEQAAGLPVALQTMHNAVVTAGRLRPGESVLIQGASSGVGLMAMLIAKQMGARLVIGSSTDATRRGQLKDFGADLAIDSRDANRPEQVKEATGGQGVDLIVDQLSGETVNASMAAAALRGRIVNVGRLAGETAAFDFDLHALKRIDYIGVTFRTRTVDEVREIVRLLQIDLAKPLADGKLNLPIAASYPMAKLGEAYDLMKANKHFGKIVVTMG